MTTITAPTGCTQPELGARASKKLGQAIDPKSPEAQHIEQCPACALTHHAWDDAQQRARPLPRRAVERLMRAINPNTQSHT